MIEIGKKYFKPHFCPDCGKLVVLVRHPLQVHCKRCRNRIHRKRAGHKNQQKKYNTATWRRSRARCIEQSPFCALCGCTHDLTCHHAGNVKTGEWRGRHLTTLCQNCHNLWETKVNKIRSI